MAVAGIVYFCYIVRKEMVHYVRVRQRYLALLSSSRTLMISGIPSADRSVEALTALYGKIGRGISEVWINRDVVTLD